MQYFPRKYFHTLSVLSSSPYLCSNYVISFISSHYLCAQMSTWHVLLWWVRFLLSTLLNEVVMEECYF